MQRWQTCHRGEAGAQCRVPRRELEVVIRAPWLGGLGGAGPWREGEVHSLLAAGCGCSGRDLAEGIV